jgi:hypothetical protein
MDSKTVIRDVLRGSRHWQELELVGIKVAIDKSGCKVEGLGTDSFVATVADIASGFVRYQSEPGNLRAWASVVLTASAVIDLRILEYHPKGVIILNALWDASAGKDLTKETFDELRELAENSGSNKTSF